MTLTQGGSFNDTDTGACMGVSVPQGIMLLLDGDRTYSLQL